MPGNHFQGAKLHEVVGKSVVRRYSAEKGAYYFTR